MPIVSPGPPRRTPPGARRAALLEQLQQSDAPVSVAEIAESVGLHPNTVRAHLEVLVRQGRVERATEVRRRRGRPRELYRVTDAPGGDEGYAVLAAVLAEHLGETGGTEEGVRAGRRWAEALARPAAPDAVAEVVRVLSRAGFAPELDDGADRADGAEGAEGAGGAGGAEGAEGAERTVRLRHCPFLDLARTHTDVVCGAHLGLLEGTLTRVGADASVELVPFATSEACIARLRLGVTPAQ